MAMTVVMDVYLGMMKLCKWSDRQEVARRCWKMARMVAAPAEISYKNSITDGDCGSISGVGEGLETCWRKTKVLVALRMINSENRRKTSEN